MKTHIHAYTHRYAHTDLRRLVADPLARPHQRGRAALLNARGGRPGLVEEGEAVVVIVR